MLMIIYKLLEIQNKFNQKIVQSSCFGLFEPTTMEGH